MQNSMQIDCRKNVKCKNKASKICTFLENPGSGDGGKLCIPYHAHGSGLTGHPAAPAVGRGQGGQGVVVEHGVVGRGLRPVLQGSG